MEPWIAWWLCDCSSIYGSTFSYDATIPRGIVNYVHRLFENIAGCFSILLTLPCSVLERQLIMYDALARTSGQSLNDCLTRTKIWQNHWSYNIP